MMNHNPSEIYSNPSLRFFAPSPYGRGVVAASAIEQGELDMVRKLITEVNNENSMMGTYLREISDPDDYHNHVVLWTHNRVSELFSGTVIEKIYANKLLPLLNAVLEFEADRSRACVMTAVMLSRCFTLEDGEERLCFVPLADMFNHSTENWSTRVRMDKDGVWMYAESEIAAGQEVFNCYGKHSAAWMLATHGFWEPEPVHRRILCFCLSDGNLIEAEDQEGIEDIRKALEEMRVSVCSIEMAKEQSEDPQASMANKLRKHEVETIDHWLSRL